MLAVGVVIIHGHELRGLGKKILSLQNQSFHVQSQKGFICWIGQFSKLIVSVATQFFHACLDVEIILIKYGVKVVIIFHFMGGVISCNMLITKCC